jgi:N-glycosylase/DNA lyase
MDELVGKVRALQSGDQKSRVQRRMDEFKAAGENNDESIFIELCFCLLTANYDAAKAIKIQGAIGRGFLTLAEAELAAALKKLGYRFPNMRAKYIVEARLHKIGLRHRSREWLAKNIKGLGYKESSHFLRNTGHPDCAIIDFHILDILARHRLIRKPKTLTKKTYLRIEKLLRKLAGNLGLNLAELDLYLWYLETGKILK